MAVSHICLKSFSDKALNGPVLAAGVPCPVHLSHGLLRMAAQCALLFRTSHNCAEEVLPVSASRSNIWRR